MATGIFSSKIDYDTRIEEGLEYHLAVECREEAFEFTLNDQVLELTVPKSARRDHDELTPSYLMVTSKLPVTLTDARALHYRLIQWKATFRNWYRVLAYSSVQTFVVRPSNTLWMKARLPNSSFQVNGSVTKLASKPYSRKKWHIWPAEAFGRVQMKRIIELSSNFQDIPIHFQLLVKAVISFNDEYFDLAAIYSAMALERAVCELVMVVPQTKAEFGDSLNELVDNGLIRCGEKKNYVSMFNRLQRDKLTLGDLLRLLPLFPFNKSVAEMEAVAGELLENVNKLRIDVLHHGAHAKRRAAHRSVITTMNLIYGSLAF